MAPAMPVPPTIKMTFSNARSGLWWPYGPSIRRLDFVKPAGPARVHSSRSRFVQLLKGRMKKTSLLPSVGTRGAVGAGGSEGPRGRSFAGLSKDEVEAGAGEVEPLPLSKALSVTSVSFSCATTTRLPVSLGVGEAASCSAVSCALGYDAASVKGDFPRI